MAQTQERARSENGAAASANPDAGVSPAETAPKRRFDLSRLLAPRPMQTGPDGKPVRRQQSGMSKLLFGFLILFLASQVIEFILAIANQDLKLGLNNFVFAMKDRNTLIVGGLTWFVLIYFTLLIALYFILLRLNILPRDPFGNKARAQERVEQARTARQSSAISAGQPRTRAARRVAARVAASAPPPTTKAKKTAAKAPPQPQPARKPARPAGAHDDIYMRVKAQQRQQRRREAKR